MKVCGIIAEYDPFHRGHEWHILRAREKSGADIVLCVMSMYFTQRGMPAILSPHARAAMAVEGGADIVLGLPTAFSVCDAEHFALGGISILKAAGITDCLSFGIEKEGLPVFERATDLLDHPDQDFTDRLHAALNRGLSFAAAQGEALSACLDVPPQVLSAPNTVLAISYVRACRRLAADLEFCPVQREGSYHSHSLSEAGFASASAIRDAVSRGDLDAAKAAMPSYAARMLDAAIRSDDHHPSEALTPLLRYILRSREDFSSLPGLSEGLENRLASAADSLTRDAMVQAIKTRRYTYARISRLMTHVLLNTEASSLPELPAYAHLLAFRRSASPLLKEMQQSGLKLYPSLPPSDASYCALLDKKADDLWSLGAGRPFGGIYRSRPYIKEDQTRR